MMAVFVRFQRTKTAIIVYRRGSHASRHKLKEAILCQHSCFYLERARRSRSAGKGWGWCSNSSALILEGSSRSSSTPWRQEYWVVPPHVHHNEDEASYVLEGEIIVQVG